MRLELGDVAPVLSGKQGSLDTEGCVARVAPRALRLRKLVLIEVGGVVSRCWLGVQKVRWSGAMVRLRRCHAGVRSAKGRAETGVAGEERGAVLLLTRGRREDGEVVLEVVRYCLLGDLLLLLLKCGEVVGSLQLCCEALKRRVPRELLALLRVKEGVAVIGGVIRGAGGKGLCLRFQINTQADV